MGMSASQARFLSLTARKNNVEFEGQQINQQRTTLSNQSASYYSELCNMVVPTPPSVDEYTKISYTFNDGALNNTIISMIVDPSKPGYYSIGYIQQWQDDYSIVSSASSMVCKDNGQFKIGSATLRKLGEIDPDSPEFKDKDEKEIQAILDEEALYKTLLTQMQGQTDGDWYVRYIKDSTTGINTPYFYNDLENANYVENYANVNCYTIGSTTKTKEVLNQPGKVEKDSSGRYISIVLYQTDDNGDVLPDKYTTYTLTTNTATDEDAYNDAMNQYNYAQHQYEKKIQEINSKLEIVQQQDKSLELNLKQLDTEENAISTELESVKKVISKNVESSFKTFSA